MTDDPFSIRELHEFLTRCAGELILRHTADPRNRPAIAHAMGEGARLAVHCVAPHQRSDPWQIAVHLIDFEGNVTQLVQATDESTDPRH